MTIKIPATFTVEDETLRNCLYDNMDDPDKEPSEGELYDAISDFMKLLELDNGFYLFLGLKEYNFLMDYTKKLWEEDNKK